MAPLSCSSFSCWCYCVCLCVFTYHDFSEENLLSTSGFLFFVCVRLVGLFHTTWARSHTQHSLGLCWLDTFSWPRLNESRYLYRNKLSIHFTRRYVQKNVFECMGTRDARSSFIIASPGFFSSSSKVYTRMHQPAGQRWPILLLPQVYYLCRHASLSHTAYTHRGQGRFLKIIIIISCWMSLARRTCLFSSSSSSSSPLYWICKTIVCVCVCVCLATAGLLGQHSAAGRAEPTSLYYKYRLCCCCCCVWRNSVTNRRELSLCVCPTSMGIIHPSVHLSRDGLYTQQHAGV
jgi:hypothetical protein